MRQLAARLRPLKDGVTVSDVVIAAALWSAGLVDALATTEYTGGNVRLAIAASLQTAPLVWRRSRTLLAVSLSLLGLGVEVAGTTPYGGIYGFASFLIIVHATARWTSGMNRRITVAVLLAGVTLFWLSRFPEGLVAVVSDLPVSVVAGGLAWTAGLLSGRSARNADEVARQQAEAVKRERQQMARELHDVVGHALAGILLTAGSVRCNVADAPTGDKLDLIHTLSHNAASDVRRLVGLLREDVELDTDAQPSLADVPELVQRARGTGMDISLEMVGEPISAAAGLELSAYRVLQEAITNIARHAPGAPAQITVAWEPRWLVTEVRNPSPQVKVAGGHGLAGLRERVEIYDGEFTAGWNDGEFVLTARMPLR